MILIRMRTTNNSSNNNNNNNNKEGGAFAAKGVSFFFWLFLAKKHAGLDCCVVLVNETVFASWIFLVFVPVF